MLSAVQATTSKLKVQISELEAQVAAMAAAEREAHDEKQLSSSRAAQIDAANSEVARLQTELIALQARVPPEVRSRQSSHWFRAIGSEAKVPCKLQHVCMFGFKSASVCVGDLCCRIRLRLQSTRAKLPH